MTTDLLAVAIDHIRSITPRHSPWTADDVSSFSPWEPDENDYAIATILNAVVSGQLILAPPASGGGGATAPAVGAAAPDLLELTATLAAALEAERAEVERLTKGSICEVAATNPSVMEYMCHWEGRAEKAEAERDTAWNDAIEAAKGCVDDNHPFSIMDEMDLLKKGDSHNQQAELDQTLARMAVHAASKPMVLDIIISPCDGMVDIEDLDRNIVRVRVSPRVPTA